MTPANMESFTTPDKDEKGRFVVTNMYAWSEDERVNVSVEKNDNGKLIRSS